MSTEHATFSFYHVWALRNVGLLRVSVNDGVKAPKSTSKHAPIMYERQPMQQSAAERCATATKHEASIPMPQLNRHLISPDRTAVTDERNCVLVYDSRDTMKVKAEPPNLWCSSMVLKLAVSRLFSNKKRQCVIVV